MGAIEGNIGAAERFYRQWVFSPHSAGIKKDAKGYIDLGNICPFCGGHSVPQSPPLYSMA
jgi:hypothetical protein